MLIFDTFKVKNMEKSEDLVFFCARESENLDDKSIEAVELFAVSECQPKRLS